MSEHNRLDLAQEQKKVSRLLKSPEGREALIDGLLHSVEGRKIVKSEFGITVVDGNTPDKPIVATLIPSHKTPCPETVQAFGIMTRFASSVCHVLTRPSISSSMVSWVRNQLVAKLYESKEPFTHVLFMDDDIVPPPEALTVLLSRNADVVAGVCTVRQDPPLPNVRYFRPEDFTWATADINQKGIYKVDGIGTGFMLIKKEVLDAVGEYTAQWKYHQKYLGMSPECAAKLEKGFREHAEKTHDYIWFELLKQPLGKGEWGEDISFCYKARECGFTIHADSTFTCGHVGSYAFSLEDYWHYRPEAVAEGKVTTLALVGKSSDDIVVVE